MVDNAIFEGVSDVIGPLYNAVVFLTSSENTLVSWEALVIANAVLFYASMRGLPFSIWRAVICSMVAAFGGMVGLSWVFAYALSVEMSVYERMQKDVHEHRKAAERNSVHALSLLNAKSHLQIEELKTITTHAFESERTLESLMLTTLDQQKLLEDMLVKLTLLRLELAEAREERRNGSDRVRAEKIAVAKSHTDGAGTS